MRVSEKEKQAIIKKKKIVNVANYKWCSYCGTFHTKEAFYNNSSKYDGLQVECKIASRARCYGCDYEEALNTFDRKEQKLFAK